MTFEYGVCIALWRGHRPAHPRSRQSSPNVGIRARAPDALSHRPNTSNIDGTTTDRGAIRRACEAYSAIDYDMDDEIGDSVICLGVIGAQSDVVSGCSSGSSVSPWSGRT